MPDYSELTQEIRFAIVLYGGVSLAIYINGVAQELLRLVRSTGTDEPLKGSEKVYAKLAAALRRNQIAAGPAADNKIRTRFRVDVISGTSAGGINGVFLAKALANEADLSRVQDLWFQEGGIDMLLNDKRSYTGLKVTPPKETESLLNSRRMYEKLLSAFDGMDTGSRTAASQEQTASGLADEIDLFATTTDLEGVPVRIQLFDNVVYERRFRNSFHFRYDATRDRNDFHADNNPFLAFAARCTSSFPFAFEPMRLCDIDDVMMSSNIYASKSYCRSNSDRWKKFYTNYLQPSGVAAVEFPKRSFGDGGYLDNAPFSYAVDTLLQRQPLVPADRKLIYVEPSPEHPEEQPLQSEKPNAVENSLDALLVIPRYETIRDDLQRVLDRNRMVIKVRKTLAQVENDLENEMFRGDARARAQGLELEPGNEISFLDDEVCYRVYYRMRAASVTDELAVMVARMLRVDEDSAYFFALRSLIRAWRESRYGVDPTQAHTSGPPVRTISDFLRDFDLPYRLRRLRFALRKIDDLDNLTLEADRQEYRDAVTTLRFAMGRDYSPESAVASRPEVAQLREEITRQCQVLRRLIEDLLEKPDPGTVPDANAMADAASRQRSAIAAVRNALPSREVALEILDAILGMNGSGAPAAEGERPRPAREEERLKTTRPIRRRQNDPAELELLCDRNARRVLTPQLVEQLSAVGDQLAAMLGPILTAIHDDVAAAAQTGLARGMLRFYVRFDLFDSVQYSMTFGTNMGEADPVEILRISPEDASRLTPDVAERRRKLKGTLAGHFGAFLDRTWRENDLLWGRLDAAERIITALLPWEESRAFRESLIDEAQHEIVVEFQVQSRISQAALAQAVRPGRPASLTRANVNAVLSAAAPPLPPAPDRDRTAALMRAYTTVVPPEMERSALMRTLARATEIVGRMMETIADRKGLPPQAKILTNTGRAFWGLVEISVPRSVGALLGKYWLSLAALIDIVLIVGGTLLSQPAVAQLGWTLAATTLILWVLRRVLWSYMKGPAWIRRLQATALTLAIFIAIALLIIGAWQVGQWYQDGERWVKSRVDQVLSRARVPAAGNRDHRGY